MRRKIFFVVRSGFLLLFLTPLATACGPTATQVQPRPTAVVAPSFQTTLSPVPTVPRYRCGAWTSNNAPGAYSTIFVFARLTEHLAGVAGATAKAVVHFTTSGDVMLDAQPVSDSGGYVRLSLPLAGRQPVKIPATISVSFTIPGVPQTINCSRAFFTPQ